MKFIILLIFLTSLSHFAEAQKMNNNVLAKARMPNIAKDKTNKIHIVCGSGDSIMYLSTKNGISFTSPVLIAVLPGLFASAMRGPQMAATSNGVIVTACTKSGNIFSYKQVATGKWIKSSRLNDVNETSKEALMSVSADGTTAFAVWLGVAGIKGQHIMGSRSKDGGKTWSKNVLVYASPDKTVCECCKPSVVVDGKDVYVMFRNWLNGNRDLYLIKSADGGITFGNAQKLGNGSWKLNGCPMDGGGLSVSKNGAIHTVWRREGKIFTAIPGKVEKEIGEGRGCTIENIDGKNVFAWTQNNEIIVVKPGGQKEVIGKGSQPVLKGLNSKEVLCVWENKNEIHASILKL